MEIENEKFKGRNQNVSLFIKNLDRYCLIKKYNEEEKVAILESFLDGQALSFYNTLEYENIKEYNDIVKALKEEFEQEVNYVELFYERKQQKSENILDYYYELNELATKANIKNDSVFIRKFRKDANNFYKNRLATSIIENKKDLKTIIKQIQDCNEEFYLSKNDSKVKFTNLPTGIMNEPRYLTPKPAEGRGEVSRSPPYQTPPGPSTRDQSPRPGTARYQLRSFAKQGNGKNRQ